MKRLVPVFLVIGLISVVSLGIGLDLRAGFIEFSSQDQAFATNTSKFRHAHLLDRAVRTDGAGKNGASATVGLVIKINGIVSRFGIVSRYGLVSRYDYDNVFYGLAAELDEGALDSVLAQMEEDPDIDWVEPDIFMDLDLNTYDPESAVGQVIPWGVDRVGATESWTASGDGSGTVSGVEIYVLDTGVNSTDQHVVFDTSFVDSPSMTDIEGHGTHIAGTIAAIDDTLWVAGVAPGADIYNIKVLDDSGETDESNVIAGIEYVIGQKILKPNTPMVMNLSFGADIETTEYNALDIAVNAAVESGITVVVAAGNDGIDASTVTPAHVTGAITVGAIDVLNEFASFSNYGDVLDLLAPGVDVLSLAPDGSGTIGRYLSSGTSMAAPHVAGAAALVLAQNPNASPQQVENALIATSIARGQGVPSGTTNNIVWVGPELKNLKAPPFYQYAITSDGNIMFEKGNVFIGIEPGGSATQNANIFSNGNIVINSTTNTIEGFGYHASNLYEDNGADADVTLVPNFNPTSAPVHFKVNTIDVPTFSANGYESIATQRSDQLELAGHYELGSRDNPTIWYVRSNLSTSAASTFSGYGVFLVNGNIEIYHELTTLDVTDETTLGLYTNGNISVKTNNVNIAAQLMANGSIAFLSGNVVYGNITTDGNVFFDGEMDLYYRPASCALTESFWPVGNCEGGIPQAPPVPAYEDVDSFLSYALISDESLSFQSSNVLIATEAGANWERNSSVHTNNSLTFGSSTTDIRGFGFYNGLLNESGERAQSVLQPANNPEGEVAHRFTDPVTIPAFNAAAHQGIATQTYAGVTLSGPYALGTWENPALWYVDGDLTVGGNTTFTGYGAIFVNGGVQFDADVATDGGPDLSALAIYADSTIWLKTPGITVDAQLVANQWVKLADNATLYGSIASKDSILPGNDVTVYHRRAACALAEPFWPTGNCNSQPLPVELTRFDALVDGRDVRLVWETVSETNNAGFEIQQLGGGGWGEVDFIRGYGTTLEAQLYQHRVENMAPGRYRFRLKQVDLDGSFAYSAEVVASISAEEEFEMSPPYPNPFNPQVSFSLSIQQAQSVRIDVYDAIGQRVAILHDNMLEANQEHAFSYNAEDLPSGMYLIQVIGEHFQTSRSIMLVR